MSFNIIPLESKGSAPPTAPVCQKNRNHHSKTWHPILNKDKQLKHLCDECFQSLERSKQKDFCAKGRLHFTQERLPNPYNHGEYVCKSCYCKARAEILTAAGMKCSRCSGSTKHMWHRDPDPDHPDGHLCDRCYIKFLRQRKKSSKQGGSAKKEKKVKANEAKIEGARPMSAESVTLVDLKPLGSTGIPIDLGPTRKEGELSRNSCDGLDDRGDKDSDVLSSLGDPSTNVQEWLDLLDTPGEKGSSTALTPSDSVEDKDMSMKLDDDDVPPLGNLDTDVQDWLNEMGMPGGEKGSSTALTTSDSVEDKELDDDDVPPLGNLDTDVQDWLNEMGTLK